MEKPADPFTEIDARYLRVQQKMEREGNWTKEAEERWYRMYEAFLQRWKK
jgi:hypothetical protein